MCAEFEGERVFRRRLSAGRPEEKWRLIRTPAARPLIGVCLSSDLIGAYVHYFRKRSSPCLLPQPCAAHDEGDVPRGKYYVAALVGRDREKCIVEMTVAVEGAFVCAYDQYRTLRGLLFEITRRPQRSNGQLFARLKPRESKLIDLPECPDVEKILCRIWEVPELYQIDTPMFQSPRESRRKGGAQ